MAEYLVELYVARGDAASLEHAAERAKSAAEELTGEGTQVRFLHAMFVPEDETCLFLYDAASVAAVRDAVGRAALSFERVVEAVPAGVLASAGYRASPSGRTRPAQSESKEE